MTGKQHTFFPRWKKPHGQMFQLLLLFLLPLLSLAQGVKVSAKFSKDIIRIGDPTELTLKVNYNERDGVHSVKFPQFRDTIIHNVEILSRGEVEKYAPDKSNPSEMEETQTYRVTSFDSGYYAIPPFRFLVNNDSNVLAESEAIMLTVNTVKADTSKAPKDIKPPLEEPFTFADALPYIFMGLGAVALITGIILLVQYLRKKPVKLVPKAPPVPPHELALRRLNELQEKKLWQEGKLKEYHSELSDILREYIEHMFPVNAMELTTDEILQRFRRINIARDTKALLKQVLLLSDMVKFAKEIPLAEENELSLNNAFQFVKATMPSERAEKEQEEEQG